MSRLACPRESLHRRRTIQRAVGVMACPGQGVGLGVVQPAPHDSCDCSCGGGAQPNTALNKPGVGSHAPCTTMSF